MDPRYSSFISAPEMPFRLWFDPALLVGGYWFDPTAKPFGYFDSVNLESIRTTMKEFQEQSRKIDADLVSALRDHIRRTGNSLYSWAVVLDVGLTELEETLSGVRPVSARFWDQIRRVFLGIKETR